jgi:hypothetical protein
MLGPISGIGNEEDNKVIINKEKRHGNVYFTRVSTVGNEPYNGHQIWNVV